MDILAEIMFSKIKNKTKSVVILKEIDQLERHYESMYSEREDLQNKLKDISNILKGTN